ncbi:nSTAND1 domain-containing NTPase [Micromonospora sp. NBC_00821]|uniref:nSTAND1 domain-containing NTPase n=1 Tax=Micromonospora sp. NBC_00821 TaxID=2975977 RepID=UPI003FA56D2E
MVEELRARIAGNYFFTVFAASGAGKSSLLRAGLLPLLINHAPPDPPTWLMLQQEIRPRCSTACGDADQVMQRDEVG